MGCTPANGVTSVVFSGEMVERWVSGSRWAPAESCSAGYGTVNMECVSMDAAWVGYCSECCMLVGFVIEGNCLSYCFTWLSDTNWYRESSARRKLEVSIDGGGPTL